MTPAELKTHLETYGTVPDVYGGVWEDALIQVFETQEERIRRLEELVETLLEERESNLP